MDPPRTITDGGGGVVDDDDDAVGADEPRAPRTIGRFTVVNTLGAGGMGTVYAAYDPQLDRKVALKLLHPPRSGGSQHTQARTRLLREAQAIAKVSHPNVIHIYEVGVVSVTDDERVFLAMELVEGPNMRVWMQRMRPTEAWRRGRAWRDIVAIVVQAGRGLSAAHAVGLMHRDFKPDNILVGDDGLVRVVDFGLARRVREPETSTEALRPVPSAAALDERLTVTGAVLGTPAYMAPEQFRGDQADERTDQFALCLTLYEALFGVRPFASDTAEGLACAVMMGELRPWPTQPPVPEHLVRILRRGLSKEPSDRFASIQAVVDALADDPDRTRRKRLAWVGGGLALLGATAAGAAVTRGVTADASDPCGAGPVRLAQRWNAERIATLRTALNDDALPYAAKTIDAVVRELSLYGAEWEGAYRDACEATHVRHEQTGELLDRRMACLDRSLSALDATVDELSRVEESSLLNDALRVAKGLAPLEQCASGAALWESVPPGDEATRSAIAAAREQLEVANAKISTHRYLAARTLLVGLQPQIDDIGYRPLTAEYMLLRSSAEETTDNIDEAIDSGRRALMIGQAAGHDGVVRDAAARLASLIGIRKAKPEDALVWADLAEATAERVGWTDAKRAELLRNRAWILVEWGLSREAIDVGERALAAAERAHGPDSLGMASAHSSLGSIYGRLREMPRAEHHFRRVVELDRLLLGDDHPDLIGAYLNLGNALSAQGELQGARAAFDQSIALAERLPNVGPDARAQTQSSLGNLLANEQRWEEALTPHLRALQLREEVYGPDHPLVARTLLSLGNAYTNLDRTAEATAAYERSLAIREAAHGPDDLNLVTVLDNLGMHLVRHGDPSAALPYLRRAEAILDKSPPDATLHTDHGYWYGRALFQSGADEVQGLQRVDQAILELDAAGAEGLLRGARAWRAEHG